MSGLPPGKLEFIRAYFVELDRKIDVLTDLPSAGFKDEALTLCLVYIDGLAQRLFWPSTKAGFNYVNALSRFGNDAELGMVHPKQLAEALDRLKGPSPAIATAVRATFGGPSYQLADDSTILGSLPGLSPQQAVLLQAELWRGTIAGVAYFWMRNPAVHGLGASTLSFGGSTFQGQSARPLDLPRLQSAAKHLAAETRRRSEATGEWFGNDAMLA